MSSKTYDILKWAAILLLPASANLVTTIGIIWSLPHTDEIAQTITAFAVLLGTVLGVSNINYNKEQSDE